MDTAAIIAGIAGTLLGGGMHFLLGRVADRKRKLSDLRMQAYADLVRSISILAMAGRINDQRKTDEGSQILADAKMRIAMFGSTKVVSSLAEFLRRHDAIVTPLSVRAISEVIGYMRADSDTDLGKVSSRDLSRLIAGSDIE